MSTYTFSTPPLSVLIHTDPPTFSYKVPAILKDTTATAAPLKYVEDNGSLPPTNDIPKQAVVYDQYVSYQPCAEDEPDVTDAFPFPGTARPQNFHVCLLPKYSDGREPCAPFGSFSFDSDQKAIVDPTTQEPSNLFTAHCAMNLQDGQPSNLYELKTLFSAMDPKNGPEITRFTGDVCAAHPTVGSFDESGGACVDVCLSPAYAPNNCTGLEKLCVESDGFVSKVPTKGAGEEATLGSKCSQWASKDLNYTGDEQTMMPSVRQELETLCQAYQYDPFMSDDQNLGRGTAGFVITKDNLPYVRNLCGCFFDKSYQADFVKNLQDHYAVDPTLLAAPECWKDTCQQSSIKPTLKPNCPTDASILKCVDSVAIDKQGKIQKYNIRDRADCKQFSAIEPCSGNGDCPSGKVCVDGNCQPPAQPPIQPPPTAPPSGPTQPSAPTAANAARLNIPLIVGLSVGALGLIIAFILFFLRKNRRQLRK